MLSRKQLAGGLLLGSLGLGFFGYWWFDEPQVKNVPIVQTGPIVFFGDSLVEGVGASPGKDMPSLLSVSLEEPVLNYGVAGDTTRLALLRLDAVLETKPRLVLVLLGGNDFLRQIERSETADNLERIIAQLQKEGAAVLLLGVRSGIVSGGSDALYETVAKDTEAAYERDVLKGIFGNPSLMSDAIHPNDRGYAKIVERLLPTLQKLLGK